jgi:two-component system sensor histidine kinase UhpB
VAVTAHPTPEEVYRLLAEHAEELVSLHDAGGRYVYANRAVERLLGRAPISLFALAHPEDVERCQVWWSAVLAGGKERHRWRVREAGGGWRWLESSGTLVELRGQPHVLTVCREISEQMRANEALRKGERILREAEQLGHTGSWEHDLVTGEIFNSDENLRLFFGDDRSKGARFEDFGEAVHPDDRAYVMQRHEQLLAEGGAREVQFRVVWPDGSVHVLFGLATVVRNEAGQAIRTYGTNLDVTERQLAEDALRRSHDEMRALSARLQAVREEESARIAREVHDEIGQMLTALHLDVGWLERNQESASPATPEDLAEKLRSMNGLMRTAEDAVQRIATELRPAILDQLGLEAAVEWYAGEFTKRTGIPSRLHSSLKVTGVAPEISTALFRILQEALTNVARHAAATEVEIRLVSEDGRIVLAVSDNGREIEEEKIGDSRSLGLLGMRERARSLGGEVVVRRTGGRGTRVEASVPLR